MNLIHFATLAIAAAASITKREGTVPAFDYENEKVRGVNLGSWFVLEPYMVPSMFEAFGTVNVPLDEYRYSERLGKDEAQQRLEKHWSTWVTEDDFKDLSDWGFNTVRIPVGYWAFVERPQDPYVQGQIKYLDMAMQWGRTHNIKIWIDMHGVPGCQNGYDNGGWRDVILWMDNRYPENLNDTYTALDRIIERYGGDEWKDVVSGIELVNEPSVAVIPRDDLVDYFNNGYQKIRDASPGQACIIQDLMRDTGNYNDILTMPDHYNVVVDHHRYQCFSFADYDRYDQGIQSTIDFTCYNGTDIKKNDNHWRVVGEWSAALKDCTKWLNGVDHGARYDGTFLNSTKHGTCEHYDDFGAWTQDMIDDHRKFIEAQMDAWEYGGNGWIFWSYKTERSVVWDARKMILSGLFPQPLTDRKFPGQCKYE